MKLEFSAAKFVKLPNIFSGASLERLKRSLFTLMLRQKDQLFRSGTAPDGTPWKALADRSAQRKEGLNRKDFDKVNQRRAKQGKAPLSAHKILIDTGALKNSLTAPGAPYQIKSDQPFEIALGTNLPYARIHDQGGVIKRQNKNGGYTIKIPQRQFMGFGKSDQQQIDEKIKAFIDRNGA